MAAESPEDSYDPSFRQQSVDDQLTNHEIRISRLEKGGLIVLGYLAAEGSNIVMDLSALL